MTDWIYPSGFKHWDDQELAAIHRVIASDRYTYGPETEAFEAEIAAYHGRRYAVACNSGSSANWLAVAALMRVADVSFVYNPDSDDAPKAIVPAIAWATTWAPLIDRGFDLVVADVDETWNVNPYAIKLPERGVPRYTWPRIVVSCPVLGNPAYGAMWRISADSIGAYLLEDCCESLGAIGEDSFLAGTNGHISTLSFYMSHQIAGIEGGACLTDDPELYRLLRLLRNHGWSRDVTTSTAFEDEYQFLIPGMNLRPLEINSAVQRVQLRKLPQFIEARLANLEYFRAITHNLFITPQKISGRPSPFGLAFTVDDGRATRARLARELRAAGIDCRLPTGGSFTKHPIGAPWANQPTPKADAIHTSGMFLGNAPYDIRRLIDRAVAVMRRVL